MNEKKFCRNKRIYLEDCRFISIDEYLDYEDVDCVYYETKIKCDVCHLLILVWNIPFKSVKWCMGSMSRYDFDKIVRNIKNTTNKINIAIHN